MNALLAFAIACIIVSVVGAVVAGGYAAEYGNPKWPWFVIVPLFIASVTLIGVVNS